MSNLVLDLSMHDTVGPGWVLSCLEDHLNVPKVVGLIPPVRGSHIVQESTNE